MGFGTSSSMNVILKNNRNLLHKRDRFKNTLSTDNDNPKPIYRKASPQVLRSIRRRMKEENTRRRNKIYFVFAFIMLTLISILIKYM